MLALLLLLAAAALEAAGDAVVRHALRGVPAGIGRILLLLVGGAVLLTYGCLVNTPRWDFGRLLGVYVCLFFVVAQVISWAVFHEKPSTPILIGGALIVAGGCVISFWNR